MLRLTLAMFLALGAMLLVMPRAIKALHRLKFGQTIYELGPESHKAKQGTPTMGGLAFAGVTTAVALALHGAWYGKADFGLALAAFALLSMLIGFVDDYIKVVRRRSLGLVWWQKVIGQVLLGAVFSYYCYRHPLIGSSILIPFTTLQWDMGIWYVPVMTLVSMFMINSANLQDGMDGLLSGVATVGSAAWAAMALMAAVTVGAAAGAGGNYANAALYALALMGALIGFLRFNYYPAKVFMGDTGSMYIGGATVGLAMVLRAPLLLALVAFTMVASSVSVILQRIYYKATHGKRIFRMSPIHHHFELGGMTEPQIVMLYTAVTGLMSTAAVLSLTWFG